LKTPVGLASVAAPPRPETASLPDQIDSVVELRVGGLRTPVESDRPKLSEIDFRPYQVSFDIISWY
jgi:hypothetical protein